MLIIIIRVNNCESSYVKLAYSFNIYLNCYSNNEPTLTTKGVLGVLKVGMVTVEGTRFTYKNKQSRMKSGNLFYLSWKK